MSQTNYVTGSTPTSGVSSFSPRVRDRELLEPDEIQDDETLDYLWSSFDKALNHDKLNPEIVFVKMVNSVSDPALRGHVANFYIPNYIGNV